MPNGIDMLLTNQAHLKFLYIFLSKKKQSIHTLYTDFTVNINQYGSVKDR